MGKHLVLSARDIIKALGRIGFKPIRQKGSHIVIAKMTEKGKVGAVIPNYDEITVGIFKSILKQAKLNEDEFLKLLK